MIDLSRSRLFQRSIVTIYAVSLPFLLLGVVGVACLERLPGRWSIVAGLVVAIAFIGWRLWLYCRALGIASGLPSARRLGRVWAPLGLLALVGVALVILGVSWVIIALLLRSDPVAGDAIAVMGLVGLAPIVIGAALMAPFVIALKRRPALDSEIIDAFSDDPPDQDTPPA